MKNKKVKKIIKITLITLASLLLALVIAVLVAYNFVIKPNADKIKEAVNVILQDEEILEEIKPYLTEEEFEKIIENVDISSIEEGADAEKDSNSQSNPNPEEAPNTGEQEKDPLVQNEGVEKKPQKDKSQYSNNYEYVKDNVDSKDYEMGLKLASRIDVGYVLGLVSGGLTDSERRELKTYLKKHFTSAEIATGIRLYTKYSYLLK